MGGSIVTDSWTSGAGVLGHEAMTLSGSDSAHGSCSKQVTKYVTGA